MTEINKYSSGKIYKIWSPSRDDLIYYGSTIEKLNRRLSGHITKYKSYKAGKGCNCRSFKIFEVCDDYRIDLVENYPCNSKEELNSREGEFIKNNMCVNKVVPCRTDKEYRIDNKEKIKEKDKKYRENNKEKERERHKKYNDNHKEEAKQYRENHKEEAKQYNKEYRQVNKELIKEKKKQYWEANKDRINSNRRVKKIKKNI